MSDNRREPVVTAKASSQHLKRIFPTSEVRDLIAQMSWMLTDRSQVDTPTCGRSWQNKVKQCLWLNGDGSYIVPQEGASERALQGETNRLIQRYGRKAWVLVYQENGVYNFYLQVREQSVTPLGGQGTSTPEAVGRRWTEQ